MTPDEQKEFRKARAKRNYAIALGLVLFVALVFAITLVRLGGNIVDRPL